MARLTLPAHAKTNLILKIFGRTTATSRTTTEKRASDQQELHLLQSFLVPISLADQVEVSVEYGPFAGNTQIQCACELSPVLERHVRAGKKELRDLSSEKNLAHQAASHFVARAKPHFEKIDIKIIKNIPFEAGLGGGSADAAAVLCALGFLSPHPVSSKILMEVAAGLGSDVPPLLFGEPVVFSGIGDSFTTLERSTEEPWFRDIYIIVVKPPSGVSTADAYTEIRRQVHELPTFGSSAEEREQCGQLCNSMLKTVLSQLNPHTSRFGFADVQSLLVNDFEEPVFARYPEVTRAMTELRRCGVGSVLLSGSGSAVIGYVQQQAEARRVVEMLQPLTDEGWFVTDARLLEAVRPWAVAKW